MLKFRMVGQLMKKIGWIRRREQKEWTFQAMPKWESECLLAKGHTHPLQKGPNGPKRNFFPHTKQR